MASTKFVIAVLACIVAACYAENVSDAENYIVGGRTAQRNRFPYMASLRTTSNQHFCGGGILSNRWVLSAAHCTHGGPTALPRNVLVFVAAHSRTDGIRHPVERIINHPGWNPRTVLNDICVIRTANDIQLIPGRVVALRLPHANRPANARESTTIAGWGLTGVSIYSTLDYQ